MKRHGVAVCLWRQIVAFGILVFLTSGGVSQAVESQAVQAESDDPEAMKEAEGWLRLDMRQDGADFFIYPSFFDANNYTQMVQYRAIEKQPGIIADVKVEIIDEGGEVDWRQTGLPKSAVFRDSGFRGRTNVPGSHDDGNHEGSDANEIQGLFKFIDPGNPWPSTFTAKLTITLSNGKTLEATYPFEARERAVGITILADSFGSDGKAWLWKVFGLQVGGPAECTDPQEDGDKLILDYRQKDFAFAYTCITPRAWCLYSIHHGSEEGRIRLPAWYSGFTWGGGGAGLLDISPFAHAHTTHIDLLHCYSAKGGAGAAKSLADALTGRVGACDTWVRGYENAVKVSQGGSGVTFRIWLVPPENAPPEGEKLDFWNNDCFGDEQHVGSAVSDALHAQGVYTTDPKLGERMSPTWITEKTITNVVSAVVLDQDAIANAAKAKYKARYPDDPDFNVIFRLPLLFYYHVEEADAVPDPPPDRTFSAM